MTSAEFPKIEQVLIPELKETFEKELPHILAVVAADVLAHEATNRFAFYSQSGDPELLSDLRKLEETDKKELGRRFAEEVRRGNALETIAMLDSGEYEYGLLADSNARGLENAEEDSEEAEGLERSIRHYRNRQEKMRLIRDWLLEEAPELREFAAKDDFHKWLRKSLESHETFLQSKSLRENPEAGQTLKLQRAAISKALADEFLSEEEAGALVSLLELEVNRTRVLTSQQIGDYVLGKEDYSRSALLMSEKEILKIRQFLTNIYGGEWIKVAKKK